MGDAGFKGQRIGEWAIGAHNPDVGLVAKANEMSENADLAAVIGLHLSKDDVRGVERGGDSVQVALFSGEAEDLGVTDDQIAALAGGGELYHDVVGESIGEAVHGGVAGFVVEARDGNDGRGRLAWQPEETVGNRRECEDREKTGDGGEHQGARTGAARRDSGLFGAWRCLIFARWRHRLGDALYGSDELIALFGNSANESGLGGIVTESSANLGDAEIEAAFEIDERFAAPQSLV